MKKLLIIDTFNLLHRAYHALPKTFTDKNGDPTNAIYGVSSMLINLLDQVKPDYCLAALDSDKPTFRSENFTAYKAQRKPREPELNSQIPKIIEILDAMEIKKIVVDGYEADDIVGTVATKLKKEVSVIIISNDRDLWQLVDENVAIMLPGKNGIFEWLGVKEVEARLGFSKEKLVDYKGLKGDPSDNIPGVFGIGEKTAIKLINDFGSLENVYKNIDQVSPDSLKEKLLESYEQALMSKELAKIILDAPLQISLEDCSFTNLRSEKTKEALEKYNFKSLLRRIGFEDYQDKKIKTSKVPDEQLSLL